MSVIIKPVAVHAIVGNAPKIISVQATAAPTPMRTFVGTGAPSGSTLLAGNGMYNGTNCGFVVNANIDAAGTGYVVGDVLTGVGGSGTQIEFTVDMVTSTGAIMDFHINRVGSYSTYPGATTTTVGGTGSGATFYLNVPNPDYYLDITTLTAPVEYVCTVSGTNSGSTWAKISGGGSGASIQQFQIQSDEGDWWNCFTWDGTTLGTTFYMIVKPYKLRCGASGITSETIGGTTFNYTYSYDATNKWWMRSVTGGTTETDYLIPPAILGTDYIFAAPCSTTIIPSMQTGIGTAAVNAGGTGYVSGDVGKTLTVAGGTGTDATLQITAVSGGHVTGVKVLTPGVYTSNPTLTGNSATGSTTGSGATFNLTLAQVLLDLNVDGRAWGE